MKNVSPLGPSSLMIALLVVSACPAGEGEGEAGGEGESEGEGEGEEGGEGEAEGGSDAVYRTCAFAAACSYAPEVTVDLQRCADTLRFHLARAEPETPSEGEVKDRLMACAAEAADCDGYLDCAMGGDRRFCQTHGGSGCNGDFFVSCVAAGDPTPDVAGCAALGLTCDGDAACAGAAPVDCLAASPSCVDAGTIELCEEGVHAAIPCPAGTVCTGADGSAVCTAGEACDARSIACNGEVLEACDGERTVTMDCAAFGLSCDEQAFCVGGDACDPDSAADSCNGDALRVCLDGEFVDLACSDVGLTTCAVNGANAFCQ
jgi:hypothetical protein